MFGAAILAGRRAGNRRPASIIRLGFALSTLGVLERLLGDSDPEVGMAEKIWVEQGRLSFAMAPHQPAGQCPERERADRDRQPDELAPLLPDQNPQDHAAHAEDREDRPPSVDLAGAGVGHVADELDVEQDDRDHNQLEEETDPP